MTTKTLEATPSRIQGKYAYHVVCGELNGYCAQADFAYWRRHPETRLMVRRTLTGRQRGQDWTVFQPGA